MEFVDPIGTDEIIGFLAGNSALVRTHVRIHTAYLPTSNFF